MDKKNKIILATLWAIIIVGLSFVAYKKWAPQEPEFDPNKIIGRQQPAEQLTETPEEQEKTNEIESALKLLEEGKNSEARAILTSELQKSPNSLLIKIAIGRSYLYEGEIEKARELFWQLDEKYPEVQLYRGITLIFYQEYEAAQAEFTAESHPEFYNAYETFDYFVEAENAYLKSLLAKAMIDSNEPQPAILILTDVLNNDGNYRDAWIMLGYSYMQINQLEDAITSLETAYNLDPEKAEALYYLGVAYNKNGDPSAGKIYINQAKALGLSLN